MARRVRASRESVAYQEDYAAAPRREQQEPLRVVGTRKKKRHGALRAQQLACFGLVLAIAGAILYSHMTLTRLTREAAAQESALETLESEYVALKAQQDRALSLSYVEDYARNSLGMVKMDNNQIEYIEMNNPDRIEVAQETTSLSGMVSGLVRSFNAILEYLG